MRGRPAEGSYTRRTAQAWLDQVLAEARRGELPAMVRTGATFADAWFGVFEPLRDPARFAKVQVDPQFATIVWPDDGLDMAPEPLYAEASRRQVARQP